MRAAIFAGDAPPPAQLLCASSAPQPTSIIMAASDIQQWEHIKAPQSKSLRIRHPLLPLLSCRGQRPAAKFFRSRRRNHLSLGITPTNT